MIILLFIIKFDVNSILMEYLTLLFFVFGSVGLGYEIEDSYLSNWIKSLLGLREEKKWMVAFSKIQNYWKRFGWWTLAFSPIIFLIIIFLQVLRLLILGVNCSTCITFHISFWTVLFIIGMPLATSLMVAGVAVLISRILSKYTL